MHSAKDLIVRQKSKIVVGVIIPIVLVNHFFLISSGEGRKENEINVMKANILVR